MSASNYLEGKILDHVFGEASYTAPTWYVALFTADPGETGASGEVTGGDYARVLLGATTRTVSSVANDAAVEFAEASAGWGIVTHFGLFDASSGATNFLAGGQLAAPKTVLTGDSVKFAIGSLTITLD